MDIPNHIAIIMDGNGRWGKQKGLTRSGGHYAGAKAMEQLIMDALEVGVRALTLYAFSSENWSRPEQEVNYLMDLPAIFLTEKLPLFMENEIRVMISGDINALPSHTKAAIEKAVTSTEHNKRFTVNFALNYGGRNELIFAIRSLLQDLQTKQGSSKDIDERLIHQYLYTKSLADPDIIIRTGGEKRISNFLLWQAAQSELWFTDTYFPDFKKEDLIQAIQDVNKRKKRKLAYL